MYTYFHKYLDYYSRQCADVYQIIKQNKYNNNNKVYLKSISNVHRGTSSVDYNKMHLQ